jgi:hypothetical protein
MGKSTEEVRVLEFCVAGEAEEDGLVLVAAGEEESFGSSSSAAKTWLLDQKKPGTYAIVRVVAVIEVKEVPKPTYEAHEIDGDAYKKLLG